MNSLHLKTAKNRDALNSSLSPDEVLIPKLQRVRNHNMWKSFNYDNNQIWRNVKKNTFLSTK